jgi:signal transduction histidine kinase
MLENDPVFEEVFLVTGTRDENWIAVTTGETSLKPAWAVSPHEAQDRAPRGWFVPGNSPTFQFEAPAQGAASLPPVILVGQATFTPSELSASVIASGFGRTTTVYIVNRQKVTPVLSQSLSEIATYKNEAGTQVIGLYRGLDDLQVGLVAEQDQAEAFAASDELAAGLIGAALGVALLTTIIAALVTRQITRPIVLLTEAALKMSNGDLSVRVQPARRDEIGILSSVFNTMASELSELYTGLENKVAERTQEVQAAKEQIQYHAWQLSISAEVGRITTSILDLKTLLEHASELIRDAFQLEHVGVYLLDSTGQVAVLFNSVGRAVPMDEHHLQVEANHPVSWVITQRMPRAVTLPSRGERNETHYELVLPLALGSRTLGALDLTSRDPNGFVESDQSVLQTLAGQLSVAIENARTYGQEHEAADEMREIDRLRGQFLMRMSHQLATYLNSILGFSQVMLKGLDGPLNETQIKDLTAIRHSGQQLSQLLNDILELANLEVGSVELQRAPADMAGLLDGLQATLVSALVNPQLRLQMHIEPDLPAMMIDADRLRQVLTNLVITAAEMSREGVIIVSVARQSGQVEFDIIAPSVGVSANGHGGISIALSRRLVELHGGRLQSEQHAGSTRFWFTLPINSSNVSQPGATDKTPGSLVPQGEATNAKHGEAEL